MRILVYDDNPDFGGHQVMLCRGIEALASKNDLELVCMANPANARLWSTLAAHTPLEAQPARIQSLKPDLVLCSQGDIAQSTAGVAAANHAGIECVSYIALPHSLAEMGAKLARARDVTNRKWLNKPDRFITISGGMKNKLIDRGVKRPISVVENGIPAPPIPKIRSRGQTTTIGVAGRIEFSQKQQDFMARAFITQPDTFDNSRLVFVGSGPDEHHLDKMVEGRGSIRHEQWTDRIEAFYDTIDLLALPSQYEGVPLVMLEALARGIPVVASAVDGMKETLPAAWTFEPGDGAGLAQSFSHIRAHWREEIDAIQQQVLTKHSLDTFNTTFVAAVLGH